MLQRLMCWFRTASGSAQVSSGKEDDGKRCVISSCCCGGFIVKVSKRGRKVKMMGQSLLVWRLGFGG